MMKRFITFFLALCVATLTTHAATLEDGSKIERVKRLNNVDRDIDKNIYAYRGEIITGITASYMTYSADNSNLFLFIDDIDASFAMTTIKPYIGCLYRDNRAIGLRLGYSYLNGTLNAARIDLGETSGVDVISIPYIHLSGEYLSMSLFQRSYVALDRKGHFGLFAEVELGTTTGSSVFEYGSGSSRIYTKSDKTSVDLNFNPGMSVFVMSNVSSSVSFGFGGINYTNIRQYDENGEETGGREKSGMSFKFNFLAVNFGITVHIWKKQ